MRVPSTTELIQVWERGHTQHPVQNCAVLLSLACETDNEDNFLNERIGTRNKRLLDLRARMFGNRLLNKLNCPACGAFMEWENTIEEFRLSEKDLRNDDNFCLESDGFTVNFRLPTSADLLRLTPCSDVELIRACIVSVEQNKQPVNAGLVPVQVLELLDAKLHEIDKHGEMEIALTCPECSHRWQAPFDICSYLWSEVGHWAQRTIEEVAVLASNFGWREEDILNMAPMRRQRYINLIRT